MSATAKLLPAAFAGLAALSAAAPAQAAGGRVARALRPAPRRGRP